MCGFSVVEHAVLLHCLTSVHWVRRTHIPTHPTLFSLSVCLSHSHLTGKLHLSTLHCAKKASTKKRRKHRTEDDEDDNADGRAHLRVVKAVLAPIVPLLNELYSKMIYGRRAGMQFAWLGW